MSWISSLTDPNADYMVKAIKMILADCQTNIDFLSQHRLRNFLSYEYLLDLQAQLDALNVKSTTVSTVEELGEFFDELLKFYELTTDLVEQGY
jgi:hypothetical protein